MCKICDLKDDGYSEEEVRQEFRKWEEEQILKYGWLVHFVFDKDVNFHTHGLKENFDHPDLQITVPLKKEIAHNILFSIIELIKEGKSFKDGDLLSNIIKNFDVKFINAIESERKVLRVVFPNKDGTFEKRNDLLGTQYV